MLPSAQSSTLAILIQLKLKLSGLSLHLPDFPMVQTQEAFSKFSNTLGTERKQPLLCLPAVFLSASLSHTSFSAVYLTLML